MSEGGLPQVRVSGLPAVTAAQMREVDRIMVDDLGIQLPQMMENAGRNLARLAIARFDPGRVLILAGPGGNGGGGLVAGRHLANWGIETGVVLGRDELATVPAHQLAILDRMGVPVYDEPEDADLFVDALLGYSLVGDPRGRIAELVTWLVGRTAPVLSLDTPSGLDVTTGLAGAPCVAATATLTLAAPKSGLLEAPQTGELYLADISVPPSVYAALGLSMPPGVFRGGTVLRLV